MELDEMKAVWLKNEAKIEKKLTINEQGVELIQTKKIVSNLTPLYRQRVLECILHSIAIVLLIVFLIQNINQFPYFASALALFAMYITLFIHAYKQIKVIKSIDIAQDLATMQSSLVILQTHILNYAKLAVLFIPTFLAFPVVLTKIVKDYSIQSMADFDIIAKSNGSWWTLELVGLFILMPIGIWFYREVSYKNIHKKWVNDFIQKSVGKRVATALVFLKELQDLKQ